jgi:hypothetical protein
MQLIAHRINTAAQLRQTPKEYGVEVDIRSHGKDLIIHHDPFETGELFDDWLADFDHATLILNVKEEGLEPRLIERMADIGCADYFFLDQSFPFLVRYAEAAAGRSAVRFSEYESLATVLGLAGKVNWVWVDCFTHLPLGAHEADQLKENGFKLCLVSPELQQRPAEPGIAQMRALLDEQGINVDAVCTKRPDLWEAD